jgi:predicted PurR-regulated permease PerM
MKQSGQRETLILSAIRIGCVALLAYWTVVLVSPFVTIVIWSVIVAVALYPIFDWLAARLHQRVLAAILITIAGLLVILGPVAWLGFSLADNVRLLVERFGDRSLAIPPPPETIKTWPLVGAQVYQTWYLASTNIKELIDELVPHLKPYGTSVLSVAGDAGLNLVKFIIAAAISGFLFIPGPKLVDTIRRIVRLVATDRGEEFVSLAGATIRNVSRGVIGIALLQALLVGIGLLVAGVPGAGLLSFLVLFCGIIQIGPSVIVVPLVIWSWFTMEPKSALLFSAYMLPVNFIDNVLRPLVMAQGLSTPMLVIFIGVIGGTLAHGLLGLFVGPIVLSIAWQLLVVWTREELAENPQLDDGAAATLGAPEPLKTDSDRPADRGTGST